MDCFTPEFRAENMRRIKSSGTQPELAVRRILHGAGFRYRLNRTDLPGKPDLVLPKYRLAVFVHGCFWHGHDCKDGHRPKSNLGYWNAKLDRNLRRDAKTRDELAAGGWAPVVIWACEVREADRVKARITESVRP